MNCSYKKLFKSLFSENVEEQITKYRYHLFSVIPPYHFPEKNFIIISLGRTGSTLLTSLLNNHPAIYCDSEIFLKRHHSSMWSPLLFIKGNSKKAIKAGKQIYGFKLKTEQLFRDNKISYPKNVIECLHKKDWKFIHLKRANILKLAFSVYKAWEDNRYEIKDKYYKPETIYVNPKKIISIANFEEEQQNIEWNYIKDFPVLSLSYEKDLLSAQNHQATANKVFEYLNVSKINVKTQFIKKANDQLLLNINNRDELIEHINKTKYAKYLHV